MVSGVGKIRMEMVRLMKPLEEVAKVYNTKR